MADIYKTNDGQPPMSLIGGGTNVVPPPMSMMPQQSQIDPQSQMLAQVVQHPIIQNAIQQAAQNAIEKQKMADAASKIPDISMGDDNTKTSIKNIQAMRNAGLLTTPYEEARKNHPIQSSIANAMMALGQGITKQPFYTDFQNNQSALQKQNMETIDNTINSRTPTNSRMLSPETNQDIANRILNGDAVLSQFSKYQAGQIAQYLPKDFNIQKSELAYKSNQHAMTDVKVQDNKVNLANNIMTTFNKAYDPKTDTYNIPPSQHIELAMNYAKMQSPTGVIAQDLVNQLTQGTAREKMARIAIYFGADPAEVGGSTQSVLKWFRDNTDAQAQMALQTRNNYQQGKVSDYIGIGNGASQQPVAQAAQPNTMSHQALAQQILQQRLKNGK